MNPTVSFIIACCLVALVLYIADLCGESNEDTATDYLFACLVGVAFFIFA